MRGVGTNAGGLAPRLAVLAAAAVAPVAAGNTGDSPEDFAAAAASLAWWELGLKLLGDVLILIGVLFGALAAVGIVRMPDVYTRMQAATKAGTLGVACIIAAVPVHFAALPASAGGGRADALGIGAQALLVIVFIFVTTPVASHLIARAAYFDRVGIWKRTRRDDLAGLYRLEDHSLASPHEAIDPGPAHPARLERGFLPPHLRELGRGLRGAMASAGSPLSPRRPDGLEASRDRADRADRAKRARRAGPHSTPDAGSPPNTPPPDDPPPTSG